MKKTPLCAWILTLLLLFNCASCSDGRGAGENTSFTASLKTAPDMVIKCGESARACFKAEYSGGVTVDGFTAESTDPLVAVAVIDSVVLDCFVYFTVAAVSQGDAVISVMFGDTEAVSVSVSAVEQSDTEEVTPPESDTEEDRPPESDTEEATPPESDTEEATPPESDTEEVMPPESELTVISISDPVKRGSEASVTVSGIPGEKYSIKVKNKSGYSSSAGLVEKTADASGRVTWTWRIGNNSSTDFKPTVTVTELSTGRQAVREITVIK